MLTFNQGNFDECLSYFLDGEYEDALFVVKDHNRVKEILTNAPGLVNVKNSRITFDNGKCVRFFTHRQDKFNVCGSRYQYLALIDSGIEVDKLLYLISRLRPVSV